MPRYKLIIEYDGSYFCGFQRQKTGLGVQGLIEASLYKITGETITLAGAGRTDAGVHAFGQVVHFDLKKDMPPFQLAKALNHFMRERGCVVLSAEIVDNNFHARFSACARSYEYHILNRPSPSALFKNRTWHIKHALDVTRMQDAAQFFIGHHDFNAFRSVECKSLSSMKTMEICRVIIDEDRIKVQIKSKSFLHNQVRIMVGSLVHVGLQRQDPQWIKDLLKDGDRTKSGITAPAHGLYFVSVDYF